MSSKKRPMRFQRGNIYHVKVAQRSIRKTTKPKIDYFPFDHAYLVHRDDEDRIRRLFRYYMVMDCSETIRQMLSSLWFENEQHITLERDDEKFRGTYPNARERISLKNPEEWLLVVPTHATPRTRKGRKNPDASGIGYVASRILSTGHNKNISMPAIAVQTPEGRIPLLCSICTKLPNYYEGKCSPATGTCRTKAMTRVPLDTDRKRSYDASIEEQGDAS